MNRTTLLVATLSLVLTACSPSAVPTIAEPTAQPTIADAIEAEPVATEEPSPFAEPTSTLPPSPTPEPTSTEALPPTAAPPTAAPAPTTAIAPKDITLYCPDCAEIGMDVNVWDIPGGLADGAMTVGRFPHATSCTQIGKKGEFVKVDCEGTVGWVKNTLIR